HCRATKRHDVRRRRVLCEAASRPARRERDLDLIAIGPCEVVKPRQIAVSGSLWMVRLVDGEEAPGCARARLERDRDRLDRCAGGLMLQSLVRKVPSPCEAGTFLITMTRTEQLHGVGRERARAIETAMDHPRLLAVLSEVLAAHDDRPAARMAGDVVGGVLRRVRLVVGE